MANINNLEFLNLNTLRNFPIKESCSKLSTDGFFTIPDDFLTDLCLAATSDVAARFYISKVSNFGDFVTVEISDSSNTVAGNFSIDVKQHTPYKVYYFTPTTDYVKANGKLVVGVLDSMKRLPYGIFAFTLTSCELETRTIIPSLESVNRVVFKNFNGTSYAFSGNVKIEARTNLKFKYDSATDTVILDAGEDLGLNKACDAEKKPILTINGYGPDADGNFTLDFTDCITLTPITTNTGLVLNDICCKPCSGCDDIETLTNRLTALESELLQLRQYYTNLLNTYENFKIAVDTVCECD